MQEFRRVLRFIALSCRFCMNNRSIETTNKWAFRGGLCWWPMWNPQYDIKSQDIKHLWDQKLFKMEAELSPQSNVAWIVHTFAARRQVTFLIPLGHVCQQSSHFMICCTDQSTSHFYRQNVSEGTFLLLVYRNALKM